MELFFGYQLDASLLQVSKSALMLDVSIIWVRKLLHRLDKVLDGLYNKHWPFANL